MLGIAIINYNTFEKTIECVESVIRTVKSEYRIYLLDNASQNESFEKLAEQYRNNPVVELIKSDENTGYARGNNICIEKAKADGCEYILISNNDIIFKENAVDILLNEIKQSGAFIVSPAVYGTDGIRQASVKAVKPSFKEYIQFSNYIVGKLMPRKKHLAYLKKMTPKNKAEVYWTAGSCFLADIKQFESIGLFDPYTFLFFEEYIISEKALNNNLKIIYVPEAGVIHCHGASMGGAVNLFTRLASFRSECYMFCNYWIISPSQLKLVRTLRCLEVMWSFFKAKKPKEAFEYIKQTKKVLKETPRKKDES